MRKFRYFYLTVLSALSFLSFFPEKAEAAFEIVGNGYFPAAQSSPSSPMVPSMAPMIPVVQQSTPTPPASYPGVASQQPAGVLSVPRDRIPLERFEMGRDLTVAESFLSSASESPRPFPGKALSGGEIFGLITPSGWTVIAEEQAFNQKVLFSPAPGDTWIRAFGAYAGKTGDKIAISPEERTVWVLAGGGVAVDPKKVAKSRKREKASPVSTAPVKKAQVKKGQPKVAERVLPERKMQESVYPSPVTPVQPVGWHVVSNEPLKKQLDRWCKQAGYTLLWEAPSDFLISGSASFEGSFEDAVKRLFSIMYKEGRMSVKATIYLGNKVVRVRQD